MRSVQQAELGAIVGRHAPIDGTFDSAIPGARCIRISMPHLNLPDLYQPSLCMIVLLPRPAQRRRPRLCADRHGRQQCPEGRAGDRATTSGHRSADQGRSAGRDGEHERVVVVPALQSRHGHEPLAIPQTSAPDHSAADDAPGGSERRKRRLPSWLRESFSIQP
jgi:hypothetical protein